MVRLTLQRAVYLILFWARISVAADPTPVLPLADEAQFHFLRGNQAYQQLRYEDALSAWYQSNRLVQNRNVQFNIARCLERLGRYDEAFRAWSSLSSGALEEKEMNAAKAALQRLRPHLALLEIDSEPKGATLYVGRRDLGALGTTPKVLALAPGNLSVLLEKPGYRPHEVKTDLVKGKQVSVQVKLDPILASVMVRRIPENAEIRRDLIDGQILRKGPGSFQIVPGPLALFISAPGHQTERVVLSTEPNQNTIVDVELPLAIPPTGALVVRSNIPSALIRLDGKEAGFCPAVIESVAVGSHRVEIVEEGHESYATTVDVRKNERAFVDGHLSKSLPEVIAATKSVKSAESAPASITIVTADEIVAMGYTSLTEALEAVRGTFTSNDRSYESVGFRGFSPPGDYTNRVLVLLDGHAMNDAVTGQGYVGNELEVDLSHVARIEVVRGPGSVLYGTGALFGVINVVTRRPSEGVHGAFSTTLGTLEMALGRASLLGRKGNREFQLSVSGLTKGGERRFTWEPQSLTESSSLVLNADNETARHADLALRIDSVALRAGYRERKKEIPTGAYKSAPDQGTYLHDHRAFTDVRFSKELRLLRAEARMAYDASWYQGEFISFENGEVTGEVLRADWVTGELRLEFLPRYRQQITFGMEMVKQIRLQTVEPLGDPIPKETIFSGYLVDAVTLHPRAQLNLGLRLDYYSQSVGTVLTPRLALLLQPYARGRTKFLVGRSFRVPSPNEQASSAEGHLSPEILWNGEIEHSHTVSDNLWVLGSAFINDLENLILVTETPTLGVLFANTRGDIRGMGVESEVRWEPGIGVLLSFSLAYQRVVIHSSNGDIPNLNSPEILAKSRAIVPLFSSALRLGLELFLDSGRHFRSLPTAVRPDDHKVNDAMLCNVTFSGEHRPSGLRYFAGLFNLFDVRDGSTGYPTSEDHRLLTIPRYGRSLRAGLAYRF